jgi:hypothetical protein
MMDAYPSPARLKALRLLNLAKARALRDLPRRGKDGGAAPAPVDPAPKPLPLNGGAEAAID